MTTLYIIDYNSLRRIFMSEIQHIFAIFRQRQKNGLPLFRNEIITKIVGIHYDQPLNK